MLKQLSGLRVLDLTRILAGPYASMVLGDIGAEIIKIERPLVGDETRRLGPPFLGPESIYFLAINRNKKSVAVDFTNEKGQAIVQNLATQSDVLIENFVPGKLKQFNLDYHSIADKNPNLIYCSLTGFGQTGAYADRPGFDLIAQAVGGMLNVTGSVGGEPCRPGVALIDIITGLYANVSILSALREIEVNNGSGRWIDCNLLSSQLAVLSTLSASYLNTGEVGRKYGSGHPSIVPYQAFQTADGYYVLAGVSNNNFTELCDALELRGVKDDVKYKRNEDRVANRSELLALIEDRMKTKRNKEWEGVLGDVTFAHGPVNDFNAVFSDPHVKSMDLIQTFLHSTAGEVKVVGSPIKWYDNKNQRFTGQQDYEQTGTAPPILGEHTRSVLTELLGFSQSHIDDLVREEVIQEYIQD